MVTHISSRQNPLVGRFKRAAHGEESGVLLLDGTHLVDEAVTAGLDVLDVAVELDASESGVVAALIDRLSRAGTRVSVVTAAVMAAISPVRSPSPIVALVQRPDSAARLFDSPSPLVVVACDVQDPGNLGAIVRVAEAGGASGVVAAGESADPYGWKALRGSMGSALRLPLAAVTRIDEAIAMARSHGCRLVATAPQGGTSLFEADLTGPLAVLIGGEGRGLPEGIVSKADLRVTVPMSPPVESLNAAVTAALVIYEIRRRRR